MHEFVLPASAEGSFQDALREKQAFLSAFGELQKQWLLKRVAAVFRRLPRVSSAEFMVLRLADNHGEPSTRLSVNWSLDCEDLTDDELWLLKQEERAMEDIYSSRIRDFVDGLTITRAMLLEPNGTVRSIPFVVQELAARGRL